MKRLACLFIAAVMAPPVLAAGWVAVLKNSPAEAFQDDDIRLFLDTAKSVLDAPGPPASVAWDNPQTGAGGHFLVIGESVARDGAACKRVRFGVYAKSRPEKSATWTACKDAQGRWRLATAG
jgi:surface antigen